MPSRIRHRGRRTPTQGASDRRAQELATSLGKAIRQARRTTRRTQAVVAESAGVARSVVSDIERGSAAGVTMLVWTRVARAAGADLRAYVERVSATDAPRDAVHLRTQELIVGLAQGGGWLARPEAALDGDRTRSRSADVLLRRRQGERVELAIVEVYDWLADVGEAFRTWDRRLGILEARALALVDSDSDTAMVRSSGCWVVRATQTNRTLVAAHRQVFRARFAGSGRAWLGGLGAARVPMPSEPGLIWVDLAGTRMFAARLG